MEGVVSCEECRCEEFSVDRQGCASAIHLRLSPASCESADDLYGELVWAVSSVLAGPRNRCELSGGAAEPVPSALGRLRSRSASSEERRANPGVADLCPW